MVKSTFNQNVKGNIFAMLFAAVGLTGVLGVVGMQTVSGPVRTITKVTQKNITDTDLMTNAKIVVLNGALLGDPDGDNYIEPAPMVTDSTCSSGFVAQGGGCLPASIGAILTDPWGTQYGYCVWDHGATTGATDMLEGIDATSDPVIAIVSAGPDKQFQTSCSNVTAPGVGGLSEVAGSDDTVRFETYTSAVAGTGGLWSIKTGDPATAIIDKRLEIGTNVSVDGTTGSFTSTGNFETSGDGKFTNIETDFIKPRTMGAPVEMLTGLRLDDSYSDCDGSNTGVLRYNAGSVEYCNGSSYIALSAAGEPWRIKDADETSYVSAETSSGVDNDTITMATAGNPRLTISSGGLVTITGNDLAMGTNTSGYIMVADGTDFSPVAVSGDISLDSTGDAQIVAGAVGTTELAADAVTDAKLADDAVRSEHIVDGEVNTDDLAADAVTDAKLADDAVRREHILDGEVTSAKITDGTIGIDDLNDSGAATAGRCLTSNGSGAFIWDDCSTVDFLNDIGDVSVSGVSNGEALVYNGTNWVPGTAGTATSSDSADEAGELIDGDDDTWVRVEADDGSDNDTIRMATDSTERLEIQPDGDIAVDTDTLFVDAVNDRVGIGTNAPGEMLHIDEGILYISKSGEKGIKIGHVPGITDTDNIRLQEDNGHFDIITPTTGDFSFYARGDKSNGKIFSVDGFSEVTMAQKMVLSDPVTSTIDASAILQLNSTTQGFLPPRMDESERDTIATPATGLQVYNTDDNTVDYYDGTQWTSLLSSNGSGLVEELDDLTDAYKDLTNNNMFIGHEGGAGIDAQTQFNIGIGINTLDALDGVASLPANSGLADGSSGQRNIAIGYNALTNTTYARNSVAIGAEALKSLTSGIDNIAIGHNAMGSTTGLSDSIAIGNNTLRSNTGSSNIAFGDGTSMYHIGGADNVMIGVSSARGADHGNAADGTGYNYSGSGNIILGYASALYLDNTGNDYNTIIGYRAGQTLNEGDNAYNILIGANVEPSVSTASEELNIGNILFGDIGTTSTDPRIGAHKYCDETLTTCFTAADAAAASNPQDRIQDEEDDTFIDVDTTDDGETNSIVFHTNGSERMSIDSAGDVFLPGGDTFVQGANAGGSTSLSIVNEALTTTSKSTLSFRGGNSGPTSSVGASISQGWDAASNSNSYLKFAVRSGGSSVTPVTISSDGYVGIGTETPQSLLNLNGATATLADSGLTFGDGDTGLYEDSSGRIRFTFGGMDRWYMDGTRITTSTGREPMLLATGNVNFTFNDDEDTGMGQPITPVDDHLTLYTAGVEAVNIDSLQSVGIGKMPAYKLDVNGTFNANGRISYSEDFPVIGYWSGDSTLPEIAFDGSDAMRYSQPDNEFQWMIGTTEQMAINAQHLVVNGSVLLGDGAEACTGGETTFPGAIRYNATTDSIEFCKDNTDGSDDSWEALADSSGNVEELNDLNDAYKDLTNNSMFVGHEGGAGIDAQTQFNLGIGIGALDSLDGVASLPANSGLPDGSSGQDNIALGYNALTNATTTRQSIAIGNNALSNVTTGIDNVAVGRSTLTSMDTGSANIALGNLALGFSSSGTRNVAIGNIAARYARGSSNYNVFLGGEAGVGAGNGDAADGSGFNYTGTGNVFLGYGAARHLDNNNNDNNVIIGYLAGQTLNEGDNANNILIGANTEPSVSTASNELNIGDTIFGDLANGYVGIGTNTPASALNILDGNFEMNSTGESFAFKIGPELRDPDQTTRRITYRDNLPHMYFITPTTGDYIFYSQGDDDGQSLFQVDGYLGNATLKNAFLVEGDQAGSLDASAVLQADAASRGFLPPRLTDPANDVTTPATGLMAYDSTDNELQVYDGTSWVALSGGSGGGASSSVEDGDTDTYIQVDDGADDDNIRFFIGDASGSAIGEAMTIDENGYVGIGTNAPSAALDVEFAADEYVTIEHLNGFHPSIRLKSSSGPSDEGRLLVNASGDMLLYTGTGTTNQLVLNAASDGYGVGMGTNAPDASAMLDITSTDQGFLPPRIADPAADVSSPATGLMAYDSTDNELQVYDGTSWVALSGGGGGAPSSVEDGDTDTYIQVDDGADDDNIRFFIGDASGSAIGEAMTIDENGYVGIGTNAPTDFLTIKDDSATAQGLKVVDGSDNERIKLDVTSFGNGELKVSNAAGSETFFTGNTITRINTSQGVVIGSLGADSSVKLKVDSTDRGFLPPRIADPAADVSSPATGLMAYDSTDNELQVYDGTSWVALSGGGSSLWTDNTSYISRDGDVAVTGTFDGNDDNSAVTGAGTRMYFDTGQSSFRVGTVTGTQWDAPGRYSFATGYDTTASGSNSTALGYSTEASANFSTAMGTSTTASGLRSTAMGDSTTASGSGSTAMGVGTQAIGDASTAMGQFTQASGFYSTAMGVGTQASGYYSTVFGSQVMAGNGTGQSDASSSGVGNYAVAFGLGAASGTVPRVTGNESFGIFFGDQTDSTVTQENVLALVGGKLMIDTVDGGSDTNQGCIRYNDTANQLEYANDCEAGDASATWTAFGGGNSTVDRIQDEEDDTYIDVDTTDDGETNSIVMHTNGADRLSINADGYINIGANSISNSATSNSHGLTFDSSNRPVFTGLTGGGYALKIWNRSTAGSSSLDFTLGSNITTANIESKIVSVGSGSGYLEFVTRNDGAYDPGVFITPNGSIGTGMAAYSDVDASARLHIDSTDQGFLPPRIADPANDVTTPATGLMAYDSTDNELQVYDGTSWVALSGGGSSLWTDNTSYISREGDVAITGTFDGNDDNSAVTGAGTRMYFDAGQSAFRVGTVTGTQWDAPGQYSFATGYDTTASGNYSTAMGALTTASGLLSTSMGFSTEASGLRSTAIGDTTVASGDYSMAMGQTTEASGNFSTAMGQDTAASGNFSTAMGGSTTASAIYSTSMGAGTEASGNVSTAMGQNTEASGFLSTVFGNQVIAGNGTGQTDLSSSGVGNYAVAFGLGAASGTVPRVTGNESFGIFFGDQTDSAVTQENVLALVGGKLMIDTVDGGSDTNQGCIRYNDTANQLEYANDCEAGDASATWTAFGGGELWTDLGGGDIHYGADGTQQVGIGTDSPSSALDVIGDIEVSNFVKFTGVSGDAPTYGSDEGITALTGDVTASGSGSVAATIADDAVTNAKLADNAVDTAEIVDSAVTIAKLSATGTADATTYLRGDGAWATVSAGSTPGGSDTHIQYNDGGSLGGDAGFTYNAGTDTITVAGDINYAGVITDTSDRRLKTDIEKLNTDEIIAKLAQIDTYSFKMKGDDTGRTEFGVMAQDIEKIFPELVHTKNDEMGTKSVNYMGLIAPMIEVSKELKSENDALKAELAEMKEDQAATLAAIDTIKKDVSGIKAHTGYGIQNASFANIGMLLIMMLFGSVITFIIVRKPSK